VFYRFPGILVMGITYPFDKVGYKAVNAFTGEYGLCLMLISVLYFNGRGWRGCSSTVRLVWFKERHIEDIMYLSNGLPKTQALCL
jgi:hypothetical protein